MDSALKSLLDALYVESVVSVDLGPVDEARANLERAGLAAPVRLERRDGGAFLEGLADDSVDLLFLDSERVEYPGWWPHPVRVVRPGGVLAIDNVLSHPDEVAPFLALIASDPRLVAATIPIGKGLHLAWRRPTSPDEEDPSMELVDDSE